MNEAALGLDGLVFVDADVEPRLDWTSAVDALRQGHLQNRPSIADALTPSAGGELLMRAASIDGLGAGAKIVSIYPGNPKGVPILPAVQGLFIVFDEATGRPSAIVEGALLTKWKTVADSLLAASILARPEPKTLGVLGTGAMAAALIEGYLAFFPSLERVFVWGRNNNAANKLVERIGEKASATAVPKDAVADADIIVCAAGAREPILKGRWVRPGAHVDLVGAHGPDMREADDDLIAGSKLFVDSREATIEHIGELMIPIANGVISEGDVLGDLYDLVPNDPPTFEPNAITVFKNGGGAHLDLMIARYMLGAMRDDWRSI